MKMTQEALAELERCAGTQFDPGVIAAFAKVVAAGDILPAAAAGSAAAGARYSPSGPVLRVATRAS